MNFQQFLQDKNEEFSSTRLGFLIWVIGAFIVWGIGSIKAEQLLEIPTSVQIIIATLMGGKVVQRFGESK